MTVDEWVYRIPREDEISIRGVARRYLNKRTGRIVAALEGVTLKMAAGEFICLLGPSGCGKTTLLNCVAGFDTPDEGVIEVAGSNVAGPSWERGVVFQDYALFPWYSVADNVGLGPRLRGLGKTERRDRVDHYLQLVGLADFANAYPHELSGGMKQRVAIARALANKPHVVLMDEPFAALDAMTREEMQEQLTQIWLRESITCLFVTHSVQEAVFLADRVVVMSPRPGRVTSILDIPLSRPRDRTDPDFHEAFRVLTQAARHGR